MARLGPYSKQSTLAKTDGRTREARLVASLRRELIAHVGGSPTVTQRILIDQACQLKLRLAMMDRGDVGDGPFTMTEQRQVQYLAWCGTLERTLTRLGLEPHDKTDRLSPAQALARVHAMHQGADEDAA